MNLKAKDAINRGGLVLDLSTADKAYKWCYEGGELRSLNGKIYRFQGARDIKPWQFKCASTAYQSFVKKRRAVATSAWWDEPGSRDLIAYRCMKWATDTREVLVLPDPE